MQERATRKQEGLPNNSHTWLSRTLGTALACLLDLPGLRWDMPHPLL